ncbi:MAG: metallophosphoesterase [Lachnospiraceae bacterium]|nr:metallophosphoesterase [Lachnospiraceae bacterium]
MTVVVLSDLHNHSYGVGNTDLANAVRAIRPDLVLSTGDLYTSKNGLGYQHAIDLLTDLSKDYKIYTINGNHEHKTAVESDWFGNLYESYCNKITELGVTNIVNGNISFPEYGITLYGLQIGREFFKHFYNEKMADSYVGNQMCDAKPLGSDTYNILLAHNPLYYPNYAKWGADLTLCGHMHGGIIRLPVFGGCVSPTVALFPKYDFGLFRFDKNSGKVIKDPGNTITGGQNMILSAGLGTHTIPIRMWNPGEVVVLKLQGNKNGTER